MIGILLLTSWASSSNSAVPNDSQQAVLPLIYKMDDYMECLQNNNTYCKVDAKLRNSNNSELNVVWEFINRTSYTENKLDRTIIHRGLCIQKYEAQNMELIINYSKLHIDNELENMKLVSSVSIDKFSCISNEAEISAYDIVYTTVVIVYLLFTIWATLYVNKRRKQEKNKLAKNSETSGLNILKHFSVISNWENITKENVSEDYVKLKSIQGIRFYNIMLIVFLHVAMCFPFVYSSNIEDMEEIFDSHVARFLLYFSAFLVSTFFIISSWLLTVQIFNHYKKHGEFTINSASIIFINRYFRLGVTSAAAIAIFRFSAFNIIYGPLTYDIKIQQTDACERNWLQTLFFVNNFSVFRDSCNPLSWYLAVDFQLYTATIITIFLMLKFKLNEKIFLGSLFIISCLVYGSVIYIYSADIIFKLNTNRMRNYYFTMRVPSMILLYSSTYSNWPTSLVGICLGIIYVRTKDARIEFSKVLTRVWMLLFFGLPLAAVLISLNKYQGITAAILGPLVKPLYTLGIGIGILGMSHNVGGIIKRICEWKPVEFLSKFTFCIYMFHWIVVFIPLATENSMIEFGNIKLIIRYIPVATFSVILGIAFTVIIEQPGLNIQKILLPQLRHTKSAKKAM